MPNTVFEYKGTFFIISFAEDVFQLTLTQDIKGSSDQSWEWLNCMADIRSHVGRPFPLLTTVNQKVEFTSEGRAIMRLAENEEHFVAHAMWAKNLAMKAMVKFLMILVPRNLFDENVFVQRNNALKWLKEQIDKSAHQAIRPEEVAGLSLMVKTDPINFSD